MVEVAGQRLRLAGPADASHLERLAALVNERYDALQRSGRSVSPGQVLAMVALNLADDLLTERARAEAAAKDLERTAAEAASHAREVESAARRAIVEALAMIDRALVADDELVARESAARESP